MTAAETVTLQDLTKRLLRRWVLMVSVAAGVLAGVGLALILIAPRYKSTAVVRILPEQSPFATSGGGGGGSGSGNSLSSELSSLPGLSLLGLGASEVTTEVGVLKSWRVASVAVDSTALMVQVTKPVGIRSKILLVEALGDPGLEAKLYFEQADSGGYDVRVKKRHESSRSLGHVPDGGEITLDGYRLRLVRRPADSIPSTIHVRIRSRYKTVQRLRKKGLRVMRENDQSRLVDISYESKDREQAAAVVNAVVNEYVAYKMRAEHRDSRYTVRELKVQVADEATRLAAAEDRLRAYQKRAEIVAPTDQATEQVKRQAALLLAQDKLQVERSSLSKLLALVNKRAAERKIDPNKAYRQLATFPTLIGNRSIQDMLSTLVNLGNQRSALLTRRTPRSRDVRQLDDRISQLEGQLHDLTTDYLQSLDKQLAATAMGLDSINAVLKRLPAKETEYLRLYRDRTMYNDGYLLLQRQLRLAEVQDAIRGEGVRVVDYGIVTPKDDPQFPKPLVDMLLGLVLALAAGVAAGLLRDLWA